MKRIISFLLSIIILILSLPIVTLAQETDELYTIEQIESIRSSYKKQENMLNLLLCNENNVCYWSMVNDTESNKTKQWLIERASCMIGEYPDKKDYAEILASLMIMQSGNLAQQIEAQSQFDDLHEGMDYVLDVVEIASSFVGGNGLLESISPLIDAGTDGIDVVVKNVEQAKYYELIIQDYSQSYNFLKAIHQYAENKELKDVAGTLLSVNDTLLQKRLEYLGDTLETIGDYEAEFFVKNIFFDILKETDMYKDDDTVKWFIDGGEKWQKLWLKTKEQQGFVFKTMMLIGNVGFGTNNTFNRYQEMRALSQISEALSEANSKIKISADYEDEDILENIQIKCSYYKSLVVTHARGEYLVYQLLSKDAGLLSQFRELFDIFKEPGDTVEGWYNKRIEVLTRYADVLDEMFVIEGKEDVENILDEKYVLMSSTQYNYDGQIISVQKFEYDETGKVVKGQKVHYGLDNLIYEYEYEYDSDLNKTERCYDEDKTLLYEYKYDKYGNFLEGKELSVDGFNIHYLETNFDSMGRVKEMFYYDENGNIYDVIEYRYDNNGYLIESESKMEGLSKFEYDDKGNKIKAISYDIGYENNTIIYITNFEYDDQNNVLKETLYEEEEKRRWIEYEYGDITASNSQIMHADIYQVTEQDICSAMRTAGKFAWDWFWDSSRDVVDESDTYMEMITEDYTQEYKRVSYDGIRNLADVLELTKRYFTEDIALDLIEQKLWYESGTSLYMSEPDGIGDLDPDYYDIEIIKESDTEYSIMVYEYYAGELMTEPYEIQYIYIDGYWVFDDVLCMCASTIPINLK